MQLPRPSIRKRPRWFWLAFALFALAQFDLVAIVPFADANEGRSAPAHVEAYGTTTHYAHDESNCAACVARQLIGRAQAVVRLPLQAEHPVTVAPRVELPSVTLARFSTSSPRAPPSEREL